MNTCTISGCESAYLAKGFCRKHYLRNYKHGDPLKVTTREEYSVSGEGHGGFKHGLWSHPLYKTWWHMLERCENPANPAYPAYGARGITVCPEWHDLRVFIRDMGERPDGGTLDRENNDGNYEPGNCRWADRNTQSRNRRFPKLTLDLAGQIRAKRASGAARKALAAEYGVSEATIKKVLSGAYWRSAEKIAPALATALKR